MQGHVSHANPELYREGNSEKLSSCLAKLTEYKSTTLCHEMDALYLQFKVKPQKNASDRKTLNHICNLVQGSLCNAVLPALERGMLGDWKRC